MRYRFLLPFLALAIAFIAIGATGQRTFIYVGIVFLVLALVMMRQAAVTISWRLAPNESLSDHGFHFRLDQVEEKSTVTLGIGGRNAKFILNVILAHLRIRYGAGNHVDFDSSFPQQFEAAPCTHIIRSTEDESSGCSRNSRSSKTDSTE